MRVFIGSDIHGSELYLKKFLAAAAASRYGEGVKIVLLGDIYNHGPRNPLPEGYAPMKVAAALNSVKDSLTAIKGNCDSEVDEMISEFSIQPSYFLPWQGRTAYFTHGHKCNPDLPCEEAKEGDIVFYGHFHRPDIREVNGVVYVCVGAIGMCPEGCQRAYAVLDEDKITVCSLDGEELLSHAL